MKTEAGISLSEIYEPIQSPIKKVEQEVQSIWEEALNLVEIDPATAPKAKGKLLRPAVCLLCAGAIGKEDLDSFVYLGTSFELLLLASLTHDDVIDRAILRRGGQSLNTLWDNHAAVLGGDYLVARAIELLGSYKNYEIILHSVRCVREMAEGELKFFAKPIESFSIEDCTELARNKTAMLFARSASSPAFINNLPEKDALFSFGENIGIAFQFIDDLLDLTQDTTILGKPRYSDITEQKVTLPILLLWDNLNTDEKRFFKDIFGKTLSLEEQCWIQNMLEKYKIEKSVLDYAERLGVTAIDQIKELPETKFKKSLIKLCKFIIYRQN